MALAPLGQQVVRSESGYVAVIFAGHHQIRVIALFPSLWGAMAYIKANYQCDPMGKTKFVTRDGEVLMVQRGVHILSMEEK